VKLLFVRFNQIEHYFTVKVGTGASGHSIVGRGPVLATPFRFSGLSSYGQMVINWIGSRHIKLGNNGTNNAHTLVELDYYIIVQTRQ